MTKSHVKLQTYVVSFQIKVREIEGNSILRRGKYLPDAVFVARIQIWEGRADYSPVGWVDQPTAGICDEYIVKLCVI